MALLQPALYFGCNQCGACCREFHIPLSHKDVAQLLRAHPEMPLESLFLLYPAEPSDLEALLIGGEWWHLLLQREPDGCIFLGEDNRCGSYESRPRACRTFPFDLVSLGRLRILPEALPIYEERCDRDKALNKVTRPTLKDARRHSRLGGEEFAAYRDLVARWNRWANTQPAEQQTLAGLIGMMRNWQEL